MGMRSLILISVVLIAANLAACNRYIDKVYTGNDIQYHYLYPFLDSNIFRYKTNIILTRDTEKIYPKSFELILPKKMRFYEIMGSTDFSFYYDKKQVISMKIDLEKKEEGKDSIYSDIALDQVEKFINTVMTGGGGFDLKKIKPVPGRKHVLLQKSHATILLYNILPGNIETYTRKAAQIKFAPDQH